jgi:hypothetical protein
MDRVSPQMDLKEAFAEWLRFAGGSLAQDGRVLEPGSAERLIPKIAKELTRDYARGNLFGQKITPATQFPADLVRQVAELLYAANLRAFSGGGDRPGVRAVWWLLAQVRAKNLILSVWDRTKTAFILRGKEADDMIFIELFEPELNREINAELVCAKGFRLSITGL